MTKIIRTPYRVSLFGGGTDFPEWFTKHGGMTVSFTINNYSYLIVSDRPPFTKPVFRTSYSKIDNNDAPSELSHPVFREVLGYAPFRTIHHEGDLPSMSGIGSSSALAVGLMKAQFPHASRKEIAHTAIELERETLQEPGGWQDQYACAYGGFNRITYNKDSTVEVDDIHLDKGEKEYIANHLFLIWTGIQRKGYMIEKQKVDKMAENEKYYHKIHELARDFSAGQFALSLIPGYLNIMSDLKNELYPNPPTCHGLKGIKDTAFANGAEAIKILGAGDGGFMLCWAEEDKYKAIKRALRPLECIRFKLEFEGSKIIYEDNGGW